MTRAEVLVSVVWAATTKNEHYIKMQGLKRIVNDREHRQEFVAGNMAEFVTGCKYQSMTGGPTRTLISGHLSVFKDAVQQIGDYADGFWETIREYNSHETLKLTGLLRDSIGEMPHVRLVRLFVPH